MKRRLMILIAIVAALLLAVSCSMDNTKPEAKATGLAYVSFGGGGSRDLAPSYSLESYDDLYWFYTATKDNDGLGTYGEQSTPTPVSTDESGNHIKGLDGVIQFSQGKWTFQLYAYKDEDKTTLVYQNENIQAVLIGDKINNVPVSVTPVGDTGKIRISNAYFKWAVDGTVKPTITVTLSGIDGSAELTPEDVSDGKYAFATSSYLTINGSDNFTPDYYTMTVVAKATELNGTNTYEVAKQEIGFRVYGNATTVISGDLTEGLFSTVSFKVAAQNLVTFQISSDASANNKVTVNAAPSGVADHTTEVDFTNTGLSTTTTHALDVQTLSGAAAAGQFQLIGADTEGEAAVAAISLTLKNADDNTAVEFGEGDTTATVTTYIATGLSGVKVVYVHEDGTKEEASVDAASANGEISNVSYESTTGLLSFTTTHFSTFYAVAKAPTDVTTTAISSAADFETGAVTNIAGVEGYNDNAAHIIRSGSYTLIADINPSHVLYIPEGETVTLDLNGRDIVSTFAGCVIQNDGTLTIKDSSTTDVSDMGCVYNTPDVLAVEQPSEDRYRVYHHAVQNYGTLTIEGGIFGDTDTVMGTDVSRGSAVNNYGKLTIKDGYFSAHDNYWKWPGSTSNSFCYIIRSNSDTAEVTINGGTFKGYCNGAFGINRGKATINGGYAYISKGEESAYYTFLTEDYTDVEIHIKGGEFHNTAAGMFGTFKGMPSTSVTADRYKLEAAGYFVYNTDKTDGPKFYTSSDTTTELTVPAAIEGNNGAAYGFTSATGAGTRSNPYVITTAEDFMNIGSDIFRDLLYEKKSAIYIKLGADIDLTGIDANYDAKDKFVAYYISGELDGAGYTITVGDNMDYFFKYFLEDTVLKNINIEFAGKTAYMLFRYGAAIVPNSMTYATGTNALEGANKELYQYKSENLKLKIDNVDISSRNPDKYLIVGDNNFAFYLNNSGNITAVVNPSTKLVSKNWWATNIYYGSLSNGDFLKYTVDISNCDVSGMYTGGFGGSGAAIFLGGQLQNTIVNITDCSFDGKLQGYRTALLIANSSSCGDAYKTSVTVSGVRGGEIIASSNKGTVYYSNSKSTPGISGTISGATYNVPELATVEGNFNGDGNKLVLGTLPEGANFVQIKLFLPTMYWFSSASYNDDPYIARTDSNTFTIDGDGTTIKAIYQANVLSTKEWEILGGEEITVFDGTSGEGYKYAFKKHGEQMYLIIDYESMNHFRLYSDTCPTNTTVANVAIKNYIAAVYDSNNVLIGGYKYKDE